MNFQRPAQLLRIQWHAGLQCDKCRRAFTELRVRHPYYQHPRYAGDPAQAGFDLLRLNVLPAGNKHVVSPPQHPEIAVPINFPQVAAGEPAVSIAGRHQAAFLDIALEQRLPAQQNLPVGGDLDLPVRQHLSGSLQLFQICSGRGGGNLGSQFGRAVAGIDRELEGMSLLDQPWRDGAPPQQDGFQPAQRDPPFLPLQQAIKLSGDQ